MSRVSLQPDYPVFTLNPLLLCVWEVEHASSVHCHRWLQDYYCSDVKVIHYHQKQEITSCVKETLALLMWLVESQNIPTDAELTSFSKYSLTFLIVQSILNNWLENLD